MSVSSTLDRGSGARRWARIKQAGGLDAHAGEPGQGGGFLSRGEEPQIVSSKAFAESLSGPANELPTP
jgi:hypothetical protein